MSLSGIEFPDETTMSAADPGADEQDGPGECPSPDSDLEGYRAWHKRQQAAKARAESMRRLGKALGDFRRVAKQMDQISAAREMGISRSTYQKMEQGDGGVAISTWISALQWIGRLKVFEDAMYARDEINRASARNVTERVWREQQRHLAAAEEDAGGTAPAHGTEKAPDKP